MRTFPARGSSKGPSGVRAKAVIEGLETRLLLTAAVEAVGGPWAPPAKFISNEGGYLSGRSHRAPLTIALNYLASHTSSLGVVAADVANPFVTDQYTDKDTGVTHIYFRQRVNNLPVTNANLNVNVGRDGRVLSVGGAFIKGASTSPRGARAVVRSAKVTAAGAIDAARAIMPTKARNAKAAVKALAARDGVARFSAPDLSLDPVAPTLYYVATPSGLKLSWNLAARTPDKGHWYDLSVDAFGGQVIAANDWVDHASYNVYSSPTEAPNDGAGTRTVVTDPADLSVSPFGWHDTNGIAGAEFTDTRGNNVSAQEDVDANNTAGFRPSGGANLNFDFPVDLTQSPTTYQSAAITNLFYWNNLVHDVHARYGFTEAAGNFQTLNYTGAGLGNDAVQADAQDGGGTNNANFASPPDGQAGRMQMYLFNYTSPGRDGDLDNQIIVHEYGHGVSNRLTGGPANANALTATQSAGMGEGWSDWWGLMFTQKPSDTKTAAYPVGTYVKGQSNTTGAGIRRYPYSFDMKVDPLTVSAYNSDSSKEVHNTGEIWCTTLWDLSWLLVDKYGYSPTIDQGYDPAIAGRNGGNNLALQLVMDALKLQPANPSFLQARDAILQSDQIRTGGANRFQIWTAFARRGMGFSAVDSSSSASTVTAATDLPADLLKPRVVSNLPIGVATSPVSSVDFTFSKAMDPSSFDIADDLVKFTGPGGVDLTGEVTGVSWLNSNTTLRVTFNAQSTNGTYSMVIGPQILGGDDGSPLDQDGNGTAGQTPGDQYTATFSYDAVPLAVASTTPANGSTVAIPVTKIDVTLNEPVDPATIGVSDLTLSQGTVTGAAALSPTSVRYTVSGVTTEGTLTVSMAAGALTDADGFPSAASSWNYNVDIGTRALPATAAVAPAGSQIYQTSAGGTIGAAGDADDFTILLDAGQVLAVAVKPSTSTLQPKLTVTGPDGTVLGTASATAAGREAILQDIVVATPGLYTVSAAGVAATTGAYTVDLRLNAAYETEEHGGATNDTIATAQPLAPGIAVGEFGSMSSVLGALPAPTGKAVYSDDFESGTLGAAWSVYGSNAFSRTQVSNARAAASGSYALYMDSTTDNNYALNEAVWTVDLSGVATPTLTFSTIAYADETEGLPTSFSGHYNGDGVSISADGNTWYSVWTNSSPSVWTPVSVNLATVASAAGITLGANFKIKFQQYDNFTNPTDGRGYDAITISAPAPTVDYYSLPLSAGQHVGAALAATGTGTGVVSLLDSQGNVLATGAANSNAISAIADAQVPADGVYYLKVAGSSLAYSLTTTVNATFDLEGNGKSTPQKLGSNRVAVGSVGSAPGSAPGVVRMGLIQDSTPWGRTSNNTIAQQLGYTVTLIPSTSLATADLSAFDMIVLAGDQTTATYSNVQSNIARIEAYVNKGGSWLVNYAGAQTSPYAYDVLPGANAVTFTGLSGTAVDVLDPTSGLITGPGGTITNTTLDGGTSSTLGYTLSQMPAQGKAILSTATPSQVVALDYPFGNGHVLVHTIPVEYYQATGNFGGIFHKNLFNFAASFAAPDDDYYQFSATAGGNVVFRTITPGDGPGEFSNALNPALDVYDPSGTLVASDDNGGSDGRNAQISFVPAVTGNYVVRVRAVNSSGEYVLTTGDALDLAIPATADETSGTLNATLTATKAPTSDLTIQLTSSDPSRLSVPASIVLPAGQTTVAVPVQVLDNDLLDGPETVTIITAAAGYSSGIGRIRIDDNETAALTLSLAGTATEGDGPLTGTITASAAPTQDVTIQLSSTDTTKLTVPASVVLKAGQTSVSFPATVVDNTVIDGTLTAVVNATFANWSGGSASVAVADNDGTITLTVPATGWEGQSFTTATVKIGGTSTTPTVVNLASSDTTEATVPATVTIPAGSTSATFTLVLPADGLKDGSQTATITATSGGLTSGSGDVLVHDADLDHLTFDTISGTKTAGTSFGTTARAYNLAGEQITTFAGTATVSAAGQVGAIAVTPATATFAAGAWTANLTITVADPAVALTITSGAVSSTSNAFVVQAGALAGFAWGSVGQVQISGVPFAASLAATDQYGNAVSSFSGPVNLTGLVRSTTSSNMLGSLTHTTTSSGYYTFAYSFTPNTNITVTHVRSYFGSKVSIWTSAGTLLASQAVSGTPGTWTETALAAPLTLTAGTTYRIGAFVNSQNYYWRTTAPANPTFATLGSTYYSSGDAFPSSSTSGYYLVDLRATLVTPTSVPITPATVTLSGGVWSGDVTVPQGSSGMRLHAADAAGHAGDSALFVVLPRDLSLLMPTDVREDDGVVQAQLNVTLAPDSDLVVQLTSTDPTRLRVPATVTIPAGQTSVTVPLTILDNLLLDGLRSVTVGASAPGYTPATGTVKVHDNEAATLSVSLPASTTEGVGTVAGTITASAAPTQDLTINLTSSAPGRASVPASVVLRAGMTRANFTLSVVNNAALDGTARVTVNATTDNWVAGVASIDVQDNDNTLTLALPAAAWEGQTLTNSGTVQVGGTSAADLVILLNSNDTTELTVPAFVVIPAGQTSATFTLTLPPDGLKDGTQSATVTVGATGLVGTSGTVSVHDATLDHVAFDNVAGPKTAAVAFAATARMYNGANEVIQSYTGTGGLTATGQAGTLPSTPATLTFASGVWTGNVTVGAVDPAVTLNVTAGGLTGTSNSFATTAGPVASFTWGTISGSKVEDTPFGVTITAKDANGFTVTDYNATANLSATAGVTGASNTLFGGNPTPTSALNYGTYTLGYSFTPSANMQVTHVRSYAGTKVSIWTNTGTLLVSQAVSGPAATWTETPLASPLALSGGTTYRIGTYSAGATYYGRSDMSSTSPLGTINASFEAPGDAFPSSGDSFRWAFVDLRASVGTSVPISIAPTTATFVNGVWSGDLSVLQAGRGVSIRVNDGSGHSGDSSTFDVLPATPSAPVLLAGSDAGTSGTDDLTSLNNSTLAKAMQYSVNGTSAGATVTLYADGVAIGSAVATGTTTIVTTDGVTAIADKTVSVTAKQSLGGLDSATSAPLAVTIDTAAPASNANPLPATSPDATFKVSWSGADDADGTGLANYDVLVSDNGGPFATWLAGTTSTSAYFRGQGGHTYAFYTVARDVAGNTEAAPISGDVQLDVNDVTPPALLRLRYDGRGAGGMIGNQLKLVFSEDVGQSLTPEDLVLTNLATGQGVPAAAMKLSFDIPTSTLTVTFPGLADGLLDDGDYTLQFAAKAVSDGAGLALDTDGDGTADGPDVTLAFHRLGGDADGDRDVDADDLAILNQDLGKPAVTFASGDVTGDGVVDFADLVVLAQHYNHAGATPADGDINGDGLVDFADLVVVAQRYNTTGRADFNGDGVIDATDQQILEANLGKSLPAPGAVSLVAPVTSSSAVAAPESVPSPIAPAVAAAPSATPVIAKPAPKPATPTVAKPPAVFSSTRIKRRQDAAGVLGK